MIYIYSVCKIPFVGHMACTSIASLSLTLISWQEYVVGGALEYKYMPFVTTSGIRLNSQGAGYKITKSQRM